MKAVLNFYIKRPLLYDVILCAIISVALHFISLKQNIDFKISLEDFRSNLTDLISTSISLAGFVLASLTIIVTFKDNINHKESAAGTKGKASESLSGLEIIFTSKHYNRIVGVFSWAAFLFLFLFFFFSFAKLAAPKIPAHLYHYISITGIILISLSIFRSLLILYRVIRLQMKP